MYIKEANQLAVAYANDPKTARSERSQNKEVEIDAHILALPCEIES